MKIGVKHAYMEIPRVTFPLTSSNELKSAAVELAAFIAWAEKSAQAAKAMLELAQTQCVEIHRRDSSCQVCMGRLSYSGDK